MRDSVIRVDHIERNALYACQLLCDYFIFIREELCKHRSAARAYILNVASVTGKCKREVASHSRRHIFEHSRIESFEQRLAPYREAVCAAERLSADRCIYEAHTVLSDNIGICSGRAFQAYGISCDIAGSPHLSEHRNKFRIIHNNRVVRCRLSNV